MSVGSSDGNDDCPMFDGSVLNGLCESLTSFSADCSLDASSYDPLYIRPLARSDFEKGFVDLLSQLTDVGEISRDMYLGRFDEMRVAGCYYTMVIEDRCAGVVVGSATLVVESKFIHGCALRGRLEDVVVSDRHRGKRLGKLLVSTVTQLAKRLGCYKLTLDCHDNMVPFYSNLGYVCEPNRANFMTQRF
nr:GnPnat-like protein [Parasacculina yatsui]